MNERFKISVLSARPHRGCPRASLGETKAHEDPRLEFPSVMSQASSQVDLNSKFDVESSCENVHLIGRPPVLSIVANELRPRDRTVADRLRDLKDQVSLKNYPSESFALINSKGERIALKLERTLPETFGGFRLSILDLNRRRKPSSLALTELFFLTDTERKLVSDLAEGLALREIAEVRGISVNTVRSHMKSIFVKTRTNGFHPNLNAFDFGSKGIRDISHCWV